jgi:autotransporter-associated beta strand protein
MLRTWTGSFARRSRRLVSLRKLHRVPRLEPLEDRLAPAVHTWTGAVDGSWANDANWMGGSPAGDMAADLVFPSNAMNFTNTNDITTAFSVQSITFSGDNNYTIGGNAITLNIGGILLDSTVTSATETLNLGITLAAAQTWSVTEAGATLAVNSVLSGEAGTGLTKAADGTLTLSAANTYMGPTSVNAGTLQLGAAGGIPSSSALTVAGGATFDLNGFSDTIGSLAGAGNVSLGSGELSVGSDNSSTTFVGVISGGGGVTKVGTGTLTLSGNNSYTGTTEVMAGSLLVNGLQPSSDVTVSSGAILGGAGTVGAVTTAGTVSPGGPGTAILTSGNVVFSGGSAFTVTLDGTIAGTGYDQLNVAGSADLTANPTLNVNVAFTGMGGDTFTILTTTGGLTGTFAGLADNSTLTANGQMFRINYSANAATLTRVVSPTTVVVASSVNPSVYGQPITFTATVSPVPPATGTPTGTVTFMDGTTTLGMSTLTNGVAVFTTTAALSLGDHSITAVYSGDNTFGGSTSQPFTQTINQAGTVTTLTSAPNPSSTGQTVTFTATVTASAPGTGTPTGTVTFSEGTTMLGTGTLDGNGHATFSTSSLALGTHTITAVYSGDTNFTTSTSQPFTQTVLPPSTTTLVSSLNPSVYGQAVTFTATVAPVAPATGTPTGTVMFLDGTTVLGTGTLSNGVASFTTSTLTAGLHSITASYSGDTMFGPSTSAVLSQMVNQASTTTTLSSSANPSGAGQAVTFTATVAVVSPGAGIPTGTVTFMEGTTTLGTGTLDSTGHATFQTSSLAQGTHTITATYSGDSNFLTSTSSPLTQTVQLASATVLTSSPNPSVFGQSVTFMATVTAVAGTGTPTGTVTFLEGTTVLGSGTLNANGVATFTSTMLSAGSHSITASYSGDTMFAPSTSAALTQTVNMASTTTTLTSSTNPSMPSQAVTFTAVVTATAPGAGTPTGTVTFMDGTTVLGTGTLTAGTATFQSSSLSTGTHRITAVYSGDANFAGSTSAALTQTVGTMNQLFVTQVYEDLLGRAPDPDGLNHFASLLDNNQATRTQVAELIQTSAEARTHQVENLYQTLLGRQADPVGLDLSTRWLGMGGSYFQLETAITGSQEYFQRAGGTNSAFLTMLYQNALSRAIDPVGQSLGGQALSNGASLIDVADVVFTSQEGLQDLVGSYYNHFLHRAADPVGLNASTTALQQRIQQQTQQMNLTPEQQEEQQEHGPPAPVGASVDQLVGVIVGSDEYFGRL